MSGLHATDEALRNSRKTHLDGEEGSLLVRNRLGVKKYSKVTVNSYYRVQSITLSKGRTCAEMCLIQGEIVM